MDASVFHFINMTFTNPVFDAFFPWWTDVLRTREFLWLLLPLLLLFTFYKAGMRGFAVLASGALLAWASDALIAATIKPWVHRPRPFDAGLELILRVNRPGNPSFPSGHALDAFFLATYFGFYFPKLRWGLYTLAFLTAYSRVYCGVHYPSDVIGGGVIGAGLATIAVFLTRAVDRLHRARKDVTS